jgi:thimet oligopeptidase
MVKRLLLLASLASCPQPGQGSYFAHPYVNGVATAPTPKAPPPPKPTSDGTLLGDCRKAIASAKKLEASILAFAGVRAVDNTVEPYNEIERQLLDAGARVRVVSAAYSDKHMREAARTCTDELAKEWHELWLDHRIYDAVKSVDTTAADAETKRFVASVLRDMKRTGVELDDNGRARVREIDAQIGRLAADFSRNLEVRTVVVTDPARLAGLPDDFLATHKADAQGTITLTTNDYYTVMKYADDDSLRKELYVAYFSRGDKNDQVIHDLLALRSEKALLLGFTSAADLETDANMLRGGKAALEFVDRIQRIAAPRAKKDYGELLAQLKKKDPKATEVGEWQKAYLENQIQHDKYGLDPVELRKYFAHDKTIVGMLEIAQASFDVEFTPASEQAWAKDVKVYDVARKGQKLGRLFLDTHERAGKVGFEAVAMSVPPKGGALADVALLMNLPADLGHEQVVLLFREMGKAMHVLLGSRHHFARQSDAEPDVAIAAAQVFAENAYTDDGLGKLGVPKDVADKLRRAERFGKGTWVTNQLLYAAVALRFYSDDPSKVDPMAVWKQQQKKYVLFPFVDGTKPYDQFEHLATYPSYVSFLWNFVFTRDLASANKPLSQLLEAGSSKDAADFMKDYLGRATGTKAFEKYLGEPY